MPSISGIFNQGYYIFVFKYLTFLSLKILYNSKKKNLKHKKNGHDLPNRMCNKKISK